MTDTELSRVEAQIALALRHLQADGALDRGELAEVCAAAQAEITRLRAQVEAMRGALERYRNEVPLGHQPHMLAHTVDNLLAQANGSEP